MYNRSNLSVTAIIICVATSVISVAEEITFKHRIAKPGDIQTKTQDIQSTMKMTVKADGTVVNTLDQISRKTEERKTTVLAMDGENTTKVKIQYISSTMTSPGQAEPAPAPYSGKTYHAEMKDRAVTVTDENGKPIADARESTLVGNDAMSLMKPDRFSKVFDGKVMKPGDKVVIPDEIARELLGTDERPGKIEKMNMVLKEVKTGPGGKQGIFDLEIVLSTDVNPEMKMTMAVKGDTAVGAESCWPISMSFAGPITIKGSGLQGGKKMEIDGAGDMKIKMDAVYGN